MSEFPDPSAFRGRIGALTALGPVHRGTAWTFAVRYFFIRTAFAQKYLDSYVELPRLQELYALRWCVIRIGSQRRRFLLFETLFVDDWEAYLTLLVQSSGFAIDLHARGGVGWPGVSDVEVFLAYLGRHHRPSSHLYARNPFATVRDLNQARNYGRSAGPPAGGQPLDRSQDGPVPGWTSMLLPIPGDRIGDVRDVATAWDANGGAASGFRGPTDHVHHGRFAIVQEGSDAALLLTAVHTTPPGYGPRGWWDRRTRRHVRRTDRALLLDLVSGAPVAPAWQALFAALGLAFADADAAVDHLMRRRIGAGAWGAIRSVDGVWLASPSEAERRLAQYAGRS